MLFQEGHFLEHVVHWGTLYLCYGFQTIAKLCVEQVPSLSVASSVECKSMLLACSLSIQAY